MINGKVTTIKLWNEIVKTLTTELITQKKSRFRRNSENPA